MTIVPGGGSGAGSGPGRPSSADAMFESFSSRGFAMGSVRGARSFRVTGDGYLLGVVYPQAWVAGENIAQCRKGHSGSIYGSPVVSPVVVREQKPDHVFRECRCGLHGFYDGSNDYYKKGYVAGVVEGYGVTIIGTRGFRSMKARILALWVPEEIEVTTFAPGRERTVHLFAEVRDAVSRRYPGIPLLPSFDDMVAEFPPDRSRPVEEG